MDWMPIIAALLGGLFGAGGVAALIRSLGQNRVEAAAQRANSSANEAKIIEQRLGYLLDKQESFQDDLIKRLEDTEDRTGAEVAALKIEIANLNAKNDALVVENAKLNSEVISLQSKVESLTQRLTATQMERDYLQRQLDEAKRQIAHMEVEIIQLKYRANTDNASREMSS